MRLVSVNVTLAVFVSTELGVTLIDSVGVRDVVRELTGLGLA